MPQLLISLAVALPLALNALLPWNWYGDTLGPQCYPPVAVADAYDLREDETFETTAPGVLANDLDLESRPLTAKLISGPAHGTLALDPDGSFTYTPDAGYYGLDEFSYKANNGYYDSELAIVTLNIQSNNHVYLPLVMR